MRRFSWIKSFVILLGVTAWLMGCAPAPATFAPDTAASQPRGSSSTGSSQSGAAPALDNSTSASANSPVVSTVPAQPTNSTAWPQHLNEVVSLPQQFVGAGLEQMVDACVQAVNLASSLNGGQTTTAGTLRQGADGNYAYESSPADALYLVDANGSAAKFIITTLTGNQANAEAFLRGDHAVQCAIMSGAEVNLEVASSQVGRQQERRIRGAFTDNGQSLSLDLSTSGNLTRDGDSFSKETNNRTVGEIKFGDVVIRVEETRSERGVSALTTQQAEVNSEWIEGATRYHLQNMFYDIAFDQSGPSELNTWQARGVLLSNGTPIGQVGLKSAGPSIELFVEGSSGRTVLNSWSR